MVKVDCRFCRYFKYRDEMSGEELEESFIFIAKHRPNEHLLGWCTKRKLPVTYFKGKCKFYKPKKEWKQQPLDKYIGVGG